MAKLAQTRSELERFQTVLNDFNCSMRLNDLDGNVFTTYLKPRYTLSGIPLAQAAMFLVGFAWGKTCVIKFKCKLLA